MWTQQGRVWLYLTDPTAAIVDNYRAVVSSMSHPVSPTPLEDGCTTQDYIHTDRYNDCPSYHVTVTKDCNGAMPEWLRMAAGCLQWRVPPLSWWKRGGDCLSHIVLHTAIWHLLLGASHFSMMSVHIHITAVQRKTSIPKLAILQERLM